MPEDDEARRRAEIERWFEARGISLRYDWVGPRDDGEWVALMIPRDRPNFGVVDGGGGPTKLAAAEDAQRKYGEGRDVVVLAGEIRATARMDAPSIKIEPAKLERIADSYGIHSYYVELPEGAWMVRVEDDHGRELYWGLATDWTDATLASIIDLEKPSES